MATKRAKPAALKSPLMAETMAKKPQARHAVVSRFGNK
jgi:hypothetical protein